MFYFLYFSWIRSLLHICACYIGPGGLRAPCVAWPLLSPLFSLSSSFFSVFCFNLPHRARPNLPHRARPNLPDRARFSAFYGQRSVTAAWATCSPWSIAQYLHKACPIYWLNILWCTPSKPSAQNCACGGGQKRSWPLFSLTSFFISSAHCF